MKARLNQIKSKALLAKRPILWHASTFTQRARLIGSPIEPIGIRKPFHPTRRLRAADRVSVLEHSVRQPRLAMAIPKCNGEAAVFLLGWVKDLQENWAVKSRRLTLKI